MLHEFGHLVCMNLLGRKVKVINLGCFSADIIPDEFEDKKCLLILFSGCLVNFFLAFIFGSLFLAYGSELFKTIAYQNIGLGIFNFLPISNLDGGQIFYILLKGRLGEHIALKALTIVSLIFVIPVFVLGFYVLMNSGCNFSLFLLSLYLISYILFKEDIF